MIEILSSPVGKPNYSTVDAVRPYQHKYNTPLSKIEYCNTVFNVPSNGVNARYRIENSIGILSTAYLGYMPSVKFYSGNSIIDGAVGYIPGRKWGVSHQVSFTPPWDGNYTFYYGGSGKLSQVLNQSGTEYTVSKDKSINDQAYMTCGPYALNAASSYPMYISFVSNSYNTDAGYVGMWQTDSASLTPNKIVIGGSVAKPSGSTIPSFENLSMFSKLDYKESENGQSQFTFEVPFVSSTDAYTYKGYYFDKISDSYIDIDTEQNLKKYRMIRYSEGYKTETGTDEYNIRFTGQIRDIKINYSKSGQDTLKITCNDYSIFTRDTINLLDPSPIDYWQAGYITNTRGKVNGDIKPRTFDGWEIHKAYESILTNCGIDPYSFYNRKNYRTYNNESTSGSYYVEPLSVSSAESPTLPINTIYGTDIISNVDKLPDDAYSYSISTGEYYKDAIDKITKSWYYKWGFSPEGYPYFKRINVPINIINDDELSTAGGVWQYNINVNAIKGSYVESSVNGTIASCDATGKKFAITIGTGPMCGSSLATEQTFNLIVRKDGVEIVDTNYNAYSAVDHFYFDGADKSTGSNTSIFKFANGLDYDSYRIVIKSLSDIYTTRIESILVYNEEYETPVDTYYTGDGTGNGTITELAVSKDLKDHRNECVVLGRRTGTIFRVNQDGEEETINANNPTSTYIQSASRDLNSVHSAGASNYVGRVRSTIVIDPAISSQEQADFISFNMIDEYGNPKKQASFTMQGNPLIEVNDCIAVVDDYKSGITSDNYMWVTEVQNQFNKTYTTRIQTTPIKPVDSYWGRPDIDLDKYDGYSIWNLKINNAGFMGYLASTLATDGTNIIIRNESVQGGRTGISYVPSSHISYLVPAHGYCKVGREVIKYDSADVSSASSIRLKIEKRDVNTGDNPRKWNGGSFPYGINSLFGTQVIIGCLPYSNSSWAPTVEFDLLEDANVDISIINDNINSHHYKANKNIASFVVDSLTNIETDLTGNNSKHLSAGHYKFSWGGFDRRGEYNNNIRTKDEDNFKGTQFYARENYKLTYPSGDPISWNWDANNSKMRAYHPNDLAWTTNDDGYSMFNIGINVNSPRKGKIPYKTNEKASYLYENLHSGDTHYSIEQTGSIKQILIDPGIVDLKFEPSDMYYLDMETEWIDGKYIQYQYTRPSREVGNFTQITVATNYPVMSSPSVLSNTSLPTFFMNKSNDSKGFRFNLLNGENGNDDSINRQYLPTMRFKFIQIGFWETDNANGNWNHRMNEYEGDVGSISDIVLMGENNKYVFDLKKWAEKEEDFEYLPNDWILDFKNTNEDKPTARFYITNYLIFSDDVIDLSGKKANQVRYYNEIAKSGSLVGPLFSFTNQSSDWSVWLDQSIWITGERIYAYKNLLYYYNLNEDFNMPYLYSIRGTADATHTNRGFYEFFDTKDGIEWTIARQSNPNGYFDPTKSKFWFSKNLKDEFSLTGRTLTSDGGSNTEKFLPDIINRNNYIVWLNEQYVRQVITYDTRCNYLKNNRGWNWVREHVGRKYPNLYLPDTWFLFKRSDF